MPKRETPFLDFILFYDGGAAHLLSWGSTHERLEESVSTYLVSQVPPWFPGRAHTYSTYSRNIWWLFLSEQCTRLCQNRILFIKINYIKYYGAGKTKKKVVRNAKFEKKFWPLEGALRNFHPFSDLSWNKLSWLQYFLFYWEALSRSWFRHWKDD